MTQPVQEPSTERDISGLFWQTRQLARRPPIMLPGMTNPWVILWGGATTVASGSWILVPFSTITWHPDLVTKGDDFDWASTDTGDPGNSRWELTTYTGGWYYWELVTSWDQVGTDGTNDFGYAVQRLFWTSATNIFPETDHRASADWPKNAATSDHEMLDNPWLHGSGTVFLPGTKVWQTEGKQTTGSTRGLSGVNLSVWFLGADAGASWSESSV